MKSSLMFTIFFFALLHFVVIPVNADPVSWVDLRADSIAFSFPGQGLIEITARYAIVNNMDHDEIVTSDIAFQLDGIVIDVQPIDVTRSLNECRVFNSPLDCTGDCYLCPIPPAIIGECRWFYNQPPDTVPEGCYCYMVGEVRSTIPYSGQAVASFALDPGNGLWEPLEGNNSRSMFLGPIETESAAWSKIKALYKDE